MIKRLEKVSILGSGAAILVIYLPLHWGWFPLSDLGSIIAALLVAGSILTWGFRERIERWADRPKKVPTANSNQERRREELDLLIKPLYCEFDKYRYAKKGSYIGLIDALVYEKWLNFDEEHEAYYKPIGIDRVGFIVDIMQKQGDSAQPELKGMIHKYLELRQIQIGVDKPYGPKESDAMHDILVRIFDLVEKRYKELMWREKGN